MSFVSCIAFVGRANHPLFIQVYENFTDSSSAFSSFSIPDSPIIKFHYFVSSALSDIGTSINTGNENYIGLVSQMDEYKVYGLRAVLC